VNRSYTDEIYDLCLFCLVPQDQVHFQNVSELYMIFESTSPSDSSVPRNLIFTYKWNQLPFYIKRVIFHAKICLLQKCQTLLTTHTPAAVKLNL
jgi:hypothetical protein